MSNKKNKDVEQVNEGRYTEEQLMVRLKVFIGAILGLTLFGIVFVVLFSLIFVTQPLNAISPIDTKFFELIIPIATFLTGTLSGIMLAGNNKEAQAEALKAANSGWDRVPTTPAPSSSGSDMGFSASGSFGGKDFSFGAAPSATPSAFGAAPTAASAMALAPTMSKSGKPMPIQDPEPEL
jgi:hypothetical protein